MRELYSCIFMGIYIYVYIYISAVAETGPWARCSAGFQWTGTMSWSTPPPPPPRHAPAEGGRMEATPPQPSSVVSRASLSPRPNRHNPHSYPRVNNWSERGESFPLSPTSLSKRFQSREGKGEGAGDHSRTEKSRQGNLGSHPASVGCLRPAGPHQYSPVRDTACPLGLGRQLPSRSHRDATRNLRSGRAWNRPPFIKVRRGPTGTPIPL